MSKMIHGLTSFLYGRIPGFQEALYTFRQGIALIMDAAPTTFVGYIIALVINGLLPILQLWLMKAIVDILTAKAGTHSSIEDHLLVLAIGYALTIVVLSAMEPLEGTLIATLQNHTTAEMDHRVMRAGARIVDLTMIEKPHFHDEVRLLQDTVYRLSWILRLFRNGGVAILMLVGFLFLLARLHPLFPFFLIIASIPHIWVERRTAELTYAAMADRSRTARDMDYCARIVTEPEAAKEIRVFGLGEFFLQRFHVHSTKALAEIDNVRLTQIRLSLLYGSLYVLTLAGGFWYVAMQASAARLSLGDIALYLGIVMQIQFRLSILAQFIGELHSALLGLRRLFAFQEHAQPHIALASPREGRVSPQAFSSGMTLQHVHFSYPETKATVLEDICAHLVPGTITALVGENGAGKSTLVKLLTRMYDPTEGDMRCGETELWEYDLASLRSRISVVYQDFAHFALTLRENIAVGTIALAQKDSGVEQAALWSGVHEIAAKLPRGYETLLTRHFEEGVELSGGEWQRVALARSFVRDAALVILDEPTSALDAYAEEQLIEHFRTLATGKMALLISHRFSTVRLADRILVLEGGRIVEEGTHAELLASDGQYARWYEMQTERYRDDASETLERSNGK